MDAEYFHQLIRLQAFFTALPLGFGLLHLILYAYLRDQRSNLFYALFLITFGASIFLDFEATFEGEGSEATMLLQLHRACFAVCIVFGLRFFYELFLEHLPKRFWWAVGVVTAAAVPAVMYPDELFWPLLALSTAIFIENLRVTLTAARRGAAEAWIVATGFAVFFAFVCYDVLMDFGVISAIGDLENGYQFIDRPLRGHLDLSGTGHRRHEEATHR